MLYVTRRPVVMTLLLSFTTCAAVGGAVAGLVPTPKNLKGSIVNDVYKSADGSFQVTCPQEQGSYEYKYMEVKEDYRPRVATVTFGPAAFDRAIYRADVGVAPDLPLETVAQRAIDAWRADVEKSYGTALVPIGNSGTEINGRQAITWTFSQSVPARRGILNTYAAETVVHEVTVINGGKLLAILWVGTPQSCNACKGKSAAFINSFQFVR